MLHFLTERLWFPPQEEADEEGLLAVGGDLSPERLLLAYHEGIFPWFNEDEPPLWWCPDPRFVLFPEELKLSKSMQQLFRKNAFRFSVNEAFTEVMGNCMRIKRKDQPGTWITHDIVDAYTRLHNMGHALSAEAWTDEGELVGGLYGIRLGNVFFGESMFAKRSNASKYAFIKMVERLRASGVVLIDCQVYTEHLESLGARMIPRNDFLTLLNQHTGRG